MRCLSFAAFNNFYLCLFFNSYERRARNLTATTATATTETRENNSTRRTSNMTDSFLSFSPRMIFVVYCGVARSHSFVASRARHSHAINIDHYDDEKNKKTHVQERSGPIQSRRPLLLKTPERRGASRDRKEHTISGNVSKPVDLGE